MGILGLRLGMADKFGYTVATISKCSAVICCCVLFLFWIDLVGVVARPPPWLMGASTLPVTTKST